MVDPRAGYARQVLWNTDPRSTMSIGVNPHKINISTTHQHRMLFSELPDREIRLTDCSSTLCCSPCYQNALANPLQTRVVTYFRDASLSRNPVSNCDQMPRSMLSRRRHAPYCCCISWYYRSQIVLFSYPCLHRTLRKSVQTNFLAMFLRNVKGRAMYRIMSACCGSVSPLISHL